MGDLVLNPNSSVSSFSFSVYIPPMSVVTVIG